MSATGSVSKFVSWFFFTCENEGVMFSDLAKSNWVYNFYEDTLEILLPESHDEKLFCNSKNNKIFEHSPPLDSEEDKAFLCIVWHYIRKNSKLSFKSRKKIFLVLFPLKCIQLC